MVLMDSTSTKVLINGIVNFFFIGLIYVVTGLITLPVSKDINCSEGFVSFWGAIQLGLTCSAGPISTVLLRRFGIRNIGVMTGFLSFCALLLLSLTSGKLILAVAMCLQGVCMGTARLTVYMVSAQVFPNQFSRVNAALLVVAMSATGAAPLIQILIDDYGWRGAMLILGAAHLHISASSLLMNSRIGRYEPISRDVSGNTENTSLQKETALLNTMIETMNLDIFKSNPQLVSLFMVGFCAGVAHITYYLFMVPYAEEFGISPLEASTLKSVPVFPCLLVRLTLVYVPEDRVSRTLMILTLAQIIGLISFMLLACWQNMLIFYIGSAFYGLAAGLEVNAIILSLAVLFVKKEGDKDYSISWCVFAEGLASIATAIVGLCMSSYHIGFQVCFGLQVFAMAVVVVMVIRQQK